MAGTPNRGAKALIFTAILLGTGCNTAQYVGCNTVEAGCRQQCRTGDPGRSTDANACTERCAAQNTCRKG